MRRLLTKKYKPRLIFSGISLAILTISIIALSQMIRYPQTLRTNATSSLETIDTLDYFVTKHPDKALTGPQGTLSQTVDGAISYYVKWNNANAFEQHYWDNEYIYLKRDHSGAPVNPYSFNPGKWMKRQMVIGEIIDMSTNRISWYRSGDFCVPSSTDLLRYQTILESHNSAFNIGGDLGIQDVIVLKYDYFTGFEKYYYSKEWGWIQWEEYKNNQLTNKSVFNRITSRVTPPAKNVNCSLCLASTIPSKMVEGLSYPVSVRLGNTGTSTWGSAGNNPYKLDTLYSYWGLGQIDLPAGSSVPPFSQQQFQFSVTAPRLIEKRPQQYPTSWQMIQTGIGRFREQCGQSQVTVWPKPNFSTPTPCKPGPGSPCIR